MATLIDVYIRTDEPGESCDAESARIRFHQDGMWWEPYKEDMVVSGDATGNVLFLDADGQVVFFASADQVKKIREAHEVESETGA